MGVKPGTGPIKSSDNTLNFIRVQFLVLLPLYLVDVLSELLLGPVPGLTLAMFGGCAV
jgi:hypothetical protein